MIAPNTITISASATAIAWTPSSDRTTIVPPMSSQVVRGIAATSVQVLELPQKQQLENLDFSFDISANLAAGDTITTVQCSLSNPAGLACVGAFAFGTLVTLWLLGGTAGQTYLFFITVTTRQGRVRYLQATILVPGIPQLPPTITVVTVTQSYVDAAVAAVAETAAEALAQALESLNYANEALTAANVAATQAAEALAAATYQPGLDYTNPASLAF